MVRGELINAVKTKVDEVAPADEGVMFMQSSDDKPVDNFVDGLLDESAKEVLMFAPSSKLDGVLCTDVPHGDKDGSGYVFLPDDFLRLLEFKMAEWKISVCDFVEKDSPVGRMQGNKYLRGGVCKPVCVLGRREGRRVLEYYSVRKHEVEHFVYVGLVAAEDVPVDFQDVLSWWCASRVLQIAGKANESQMAYERGKSLL